MHARMMRRVRAGRRGFGLVELLFFLTLIVLGVWMAMAAARQSGREARRNEQRLTWTQATTLTFEHLEQDLTRTSATRAEEVDVPGESGGGLLTVPIKDDHREALVTYRFDQAQGILWREETGVRGGKTTKAPIPFQFGQVRFQRDAGRVIVTMEPAISQYDTLNHAATAVDKPVRFEGRLPTLSLAEQYPELAPLPREREEPGRAGI